MKAHYNLKIFISAVILLIMVGSCKNDEESIKENLTVREAVNSGGNMLISVQIDTPLQLNLALSPGNRTVTEASYNGRHTDVATYSHSGLITGLTVGRDTVTITSGNLRVWYIIEVKE